MYAADSDLSQMEQSKPTATSNSKVGIYKISQAKEIFLVVMIDETAKVIKNMIESSSENKALWACTETNLDCGNGNESISVCSQYGGKDSLDMIQKTSKLSGTPPLVKLTCEIVNELRY